MCPPVNSWPPGPGPPGRPPAAAEERHKGTEEGLQAAPSPPPPPSSPPTRGQPEAGQGDGGPAPPLPGPGGTPPPGGTRHPGRGATAAESAAVRRVPPVSRPPLPQCPRQAGSPAPVRKSTLWAATGRRHSDVSQCSVEGGAQTKQPALVLAQGGRKDRPQQGDLPAPRPAGPPSRAPEEGRRTNHPPPPTRLIPRRPSRPRPPPGAAKRPRPSMYAWQGCAGNEGGPGPGATGHPPRGGG